MANLKKINVNNQTYDLGYTEVASADAKGLMSSADKSKLDAMKEASVTEAAIAAAKKAGEDAQTDATKALNDAATNAAAIAVNSSAISEAKTAASAAQDAADAAQEAADAAQDDVDAVEGRVDTLETSMGTAESNIQSHSDAISDIQDELKTMATSSAITNLQQQIDAVNAGQNLADMVATKAALDTLAAGNDMPEGNSYKKLNAGDKVQVLADETKNGAATVYNWTGSAFEYIGLYGQDAYTKSEIDTKLSEVEAHANKVDFSVEGEVLTISVVGHTAA